MNVRWTGIALDRLADFYVTQSLADQDEIARMVEFINKELSVRPDHHGESREAGVRVWFHGRLMVRYAISPPKNEVLVFDLSRLGSGSR